MRLHYKVESLYPFEFAVVKHDNIDLWDYLCCLQNYSLVIDYFQDYLDSKTFSVTREHLETPEFKFLISVTKDCYDLFEDVFSEVSSSKGIDINEFGDKTLIYDFSDESNIWVSNTFIKSFVDLLKERRFAYLDMRSKWATKQLLAESWFELSFGYAGKYLEKFNNKDMWRYPMPVDLVGIFQGVDTLESVLGKVVGGDKNLKREVLSAFYLIYKIYLDI